MPHRVHVYPAPEWDGLPIETIESDDPAEVRSIAQQAASRTGDARRISISPDPTLCKSLEAFLSLFHAEGDLPGAETSPLANRDAQAWESAGVCTPAEFLHEIAK
jgi:hypothetical protein